LNAIQNSELLTKSEQKNFASLDAVTQARIRYRIILSESAQFEGAAQERAASAAGQFDKLTRSTDELSKALGVVLVPGLAQVAGGIAEAASVATELTKGFGSMAAAATIARNELILLAALPLGPLGIIGAAIGAFAAGPVSEPAASATPPANGGGADAKALAARR
jgi:hypothetical protein